MHTRPVAWRAALVLAGIACLLDERCRPLLRATGAWCAEPSTLASPRDTVPSAPGPHAFTIRRCPMTCPIDQTERTIAERQRIEIAPCPQCRGVWLDRGELATLVERQARLTPAPPVDGERGAGPGEERWRAQHAPAAPSPVRGPSAVPRTDREHDDDDGRRRYGQRQRGGWPDDLFDVDDDPCRWSRTTATSRTVLRVPAPASMSRDRGTSTTARTVSSWRHRFARRSPGAWRPCSHQGIAWYSPTEPALEPCAIMTCAHP